METHLTLLPLVTGAEVAFWLLAPVMVLAVLAGVGFGSLLFFAVGNAIVSSPVGLDRANTEFGGNTQGIAALVFNRYVFAFEATSALLITAAVGAMVLAHRERLVLKRLQADLTVDPMRRYAESG